MLDIFTALNSKLMEEKYDGMYLIRGSNNVESEKVFVIRLCDKSVNFAVMIYAGVISVD